MKKVSEPWGTHLSPEFRLAVATCVWPQGHHRTHCIERALTQAIDWDLFLRIVRRHRIEGLAYRALNTAPPSIPDSSLSTLKAAAERQAHKSLLYAGETIRVCRTLRDTGIAAASLKGASLSMIAFADLSLRHCRDIDLLVSVDEALKADEVLNILGYKLEMPIGPHTLQQKKDWITTHKHFEYKSSTGIPLELHWRLFDNTGLLNIEIHPSTFVEVPVLGSSSLPTLPLRNLLLYLCVHGANHMWSRLKWLADIQALLRQATPGTISQLQSDAAKNNCERSVAQTLALTQLLFDLPSAHLVLPIDAATSALVRSALTAMTSGQAALELEAVPFGTSRLALARYRLKPNWRFWLRESSAALSDERDRKSLRLPHAMRSLLPFLRFPMWAGRRILGRGQSNR